MAPRDQSDVPPLYIALDFGATLSKLSLGVLDKGQVKTLAICPEPIETILWYDSVAGDLKFDPSKKAGLSDGEGDLPLRYFKLLLAADDFSNSERSEDISWAIDASYGRIRTSKMSWEIVAIFLEGLWKMAYVKARLYSPRSDVHASIAFPDIWTEEDRGRFRQAVAQAGIDRDATSVSYFTEHECAMKFALHTSHLGPLAKSGGTTVVVDCGGITADGVLFQTTEPSPGQRQQVIIVKSASRLVGEVGITVALQRRLDAKFAEQSGRKDWKKVPELLRDSQQILEHLQAYKVREFSTNLTQRATTKYNTSCGRIAFHPDDLIQASEEVANGIAAVAKDLHNAALENQQMPQAVIFTGGTILAPHLQDRIRDKISSCLVGKPDILFLDRDMSLKAVARGALLLAAGST